MAYPSKYKDAQVEILGVPSVARQLVAGSASNNTALTPSVQRISIRAVGADIRFSIGKGTQTANGNTSNFIANGERLDFAVPASSERDKDPTSPTYGQLVNGPNIAIIRDGTVNGTLELTELI